MSKSAAMSCHENLRCDYMRIIHITLTDVNFIMVVFSPRVLRDRARSAVLDMSRHIPLYVCVLRSARALHALRCRRLAPSLRPLPRLLAQMSRTTNSYATKLRSHTHAPTDLSRVFTVRACSDDCSERYSASNHSRKFRRVLVRARSDETVKARLYTTFVDFDDVPIFTLYLPTMSVPHIIHDLGYKPSSRK